MKRVFDCYIHLFKSSAASVFNKFSSVHDDYGILFTGGRGGLVSSRSDPHNVCFSGQRSSSVGAGRLVRIHTTGATASTVHRTRIEPQVRVQLTRDINGNLLQVFRPPF